MKELTVDQIVARIQEAGNEVLFVVAPNYETRSLVWQKAVDLLLTDIDEHPYVQVGIMILQSDRHQNVVLDLRKEHHVQNAREHLKQYDRRRLWVEEIVMSYPLSFSVGWLESKLRSWIEPLAKPITVCLDISALPRRVILGFMDVLQLFVTAGYVSNLFLLYAWAADYPWEKRPAHVGVLQMRKDNLRLEDFIGRVSHVRGVLFAGRQGYDSMLFLSSLPASARVDAHIVMEKDDPLSSLGRIYANYSLLKGLDVSANANLHYTFSISRGHEMAVECAKDTVTEWGRIPDRDRSCIFLVAPLGPKPTSVSAHIANSIVGRCGIKSGIVLLSSHQYSDLYSVGCKHVSCFEVNLQELTGDWNDCDQGV